MATRKKKTDSVVMDMPGTIGGAKLIFPEDSNKTVWPKVTVGSHSTRTEYEDGRVEFVSDWDALVRDVREALLRHESNIPALQESIVEYEAENGKAKVKAPPKRTTKKKV